MQSEYDFSQAVKNPYAKHLKKNVLVTIDDDDMNYFQNLAQEMGVSYQTLIHSFLHECAVQHRKPLLSK
ncbi:antitoxin [Kingella kingae]|uniref:antitoxin n=1 Tax=Kingella kingae TaxID=504 RepID=UPI00041C6826|nr:antitoxin [Kingella kingae]MDK4576491.1 antitoxin [Kingella kingae]MDK4582562.1 antitoxin [Kingella kingae]MDK4592635.1 antitoxin [Kingella kingae]MDK4594721.1 antitoxin [Kingella kingae]MDK4596755.1 antitoxin [Kingella kingae]